jgi:dihydroflavonol-4-reductase
MHAAVTGATGLLGANLVAALHAAGHTVTATRRATSKTALLDPFGVQWVHAPLSDPDALAGAFAGADVVFHCAAAVSIRKKPRPWIVAANITGTDHVLQAIRSAGVRRLVHCSSTVCVGLSDDGEPCTEDQSWNFAERKLDDAYNTTKWQSEQRVQAAADDGMDAVIVNPGFMFGPMDQRPSSGRMLLELAAGRIPAATPGRNSFVDVRDVAAGMLAAAKLGVAGQRYILAGENLTYGDLFARAAAIAGVKPPTARIPLWMARIGGLLGDLQEAFIDGDPMLNTPSVLYGYESGFIFSSDKARRDLGYTTRPVDDGIAAAFDWFAKNRMWTRPA